MHLRMTSIPFVMCASAPFHDTTIALLTLYFTKEPNLTQSRLTLLIDSLASGADVYSSSSGPDGKRTNEMEVILGDS